MHVRHHVLVGLCACWNNFRYVTKFFCLHNTGHVSQMYIASKTSRWYLERPRLRILKSASQYCSQQDLLDARWHAIADWYSSGLTRVFGGRPLRFSSVLVKRWRGTCCLMRSFNLWDVLPTYRLSQCRHSYWYITLLRVRVGRRSFGRENARVVLKTARTSTA